MTKLLSLLKWGRRHSLTRTGSSQFQSQQAWLCNDRLCLRLVLHIVAQSIGVGNGTGPFVDKSGHLNTGSNTENFCPNLSQILKLMQVIEQAIMTPLTRSDLLNWRCDLHMHKKLMQSAKTKTVATNKWWICDVTYICIVNSWYCNEKLEFSTTVHVNYSFRSTPPLSNYASDICRLLVFSASIS